MATQRISTAPSTIDAAAQRLRAMVLAVEEGALLGSEESLQAALGVSRATVRQAARLLEREGLLRVRRGINGGYFGGRPNADTIETIVGTYMEVLNVAPGDIITIATVLWVEAVRKAAGLATPEIRALSTRYLATITALAPDAPFHSIRDMETAFRSEFFALSDSRYIELIFHFNMAFAHRRFADAPSDRDGSTEHLEFIAGWRAAKQMELSAIIDGDPDLAAMAARRVRTLWNRRVWQGE